MYEDADKTEAPTPRRRAEARENGQVAVSRELTAALTLLAVILLARAVGPWTWSKLSTLTAGFLNTGQNISTHTLSAELVTGFATALGLVAAIAVAAWLVTWLCAHGQVRFLWTTKPLSPDLSRLSPGQGWKKITGADAGVRLTTVTLKLALLCALVVWSVRNDIPQMIALTQTEAAQLPVAAGTLLWSIALKVALLLVGLGAIDFLIARARHERSLRMTRQQVKDEMKRMGIDLVIRKRREHTSRKLTLANQSANFAATVPTASVIILADNTAVAVRYEQDATALPTLVAIGSKGLALRIKQIGRASNVPVIENHRLAESLAQHAKIGVAVPPAFLDQVAEILAQSYQMTATRLAG